LDETACYEVASNDCPALVSGVIVANMNRRVFSRVHAAALGREWDLLEDLGVGPGTFRPPCHPTHFESWFLEFLSQNEINGIR